jgi:uncharacterized protein (DUF3820 family)
MIEHLNGVDFLIKNYMDLGILTIQKLKEFALNRNGYFRHDLKQFGIKRKLNKKDILQIFERLDINVNIIASSEKNEDNSISNEIVDFGKYKGLRWSNIPLNYLEWLWNVNENKFAYGEIKRRKNALLDIENIAIGIGKYKGQKWINVPTDYLEWILTKFDDEHETYKFAKTVLNQRIDSD